MNNIFMLEEEQDEIPQTYEEKVEQAQETLRLASEISRDYYNEPLIITYSGGKDSDVMLHIAESCLANDEFEVLNSHTTVDAPQTVKHIEKVFRRLNEKGIQTRYSNRYPVKHSMWSLIVDKQMPPTRLMRYCCAVLKESATPNRVCAVGVRGDESQNRRGRSLFK